MNICSLSEIWQVFKRFQKFKSITILLIKLATNGNSAIMPSMLLKQYNTFTWNENEMRMFAFKPFMRIYGMLLLPVNPKRPNITKHINAIITVLLSWNSLNYFESENAKCFALLSWKQTKNWFVQKILHTLANAMMQQIRTVYFLKKQLRSDGNMDLKQYMASVCTPIGR